MWQLPRLNFFSFSSFIVLFFSLLVVLLKFSFEKKSQKYLEKWWMLFYLCTRFRGGMLVLVFESGSLKNVEKKFDKDLEGMRS